MTPSLLACDLNTEPPNISILMTSKHMRNPRSVRPMLRHLPRVSTSLVTGMPQHTPETKVSCGGQQNLEALGRWGHGQANHFN